MLRKLFTLLVCLMAAVATASAQTPPDNEIWYTTTNGRPLFINCGYAESVDLYMYSDTYNNGRGVLKFESGGYINFIDYGLFDDNDRLKSITIPESVTEIGSWAFSGCSSLKSITIPNSVKSIGYYAFQDCSSLTSITIPNGVTSIGEEAFKGCSSLTSITIPNSVTEIGISAFYGCSSLKSITIGNGVTSIECEAFKGCSNLKSITIPESVTSIVAGAFAGCSSLKSVKVSNKYCYDYFEDKVDDIAFYGANASDDGRCLIIDGELKLFIAKGITEYTIPESVTSIGKEAFAGCSSLKSVKVSNKYCYDYFKDKVDDIAFYGANASDDGRCLIINGKLERLIAKGITEYTIFNSVTSIGEYAFSGCSSLTSITIPNSVTSIGEGAFAICSNLKSITIPDSVKRIGNGVFRYCSSLTSITIPNSVTSIGHAAFLGCSSLKSVKVSNKYCCDYFKGMVANITFYGANASDDGRCLIIDGKLERFIAKGITEYTISNSATSIGDGAFSYCSNLKSITIPNSVTSIGYEAFKGCSSLTSITIPNSVTSIGRSAFYDCSSLTSITIGNGVTSIGDYAFYDCSRLKSVKVSNKYCYDYFEDKIANIAFYGANASDDGRCLIIDGKLKIFIAKGITEYTIPESVTSIGEKTFYNCSSLTSITIPNSVTSIGEDAFKGCSSLTSITIPNSVKSIGDYAFAGCSSLTSITIPNSVTSIGKGAFLGCSSLTSITCLATTPPAIGNLRIGETTMIYVPKEAVKAYKQDPNWSIYKKQIKAIK